MKVHFIAIGGSAMHNLAIALKQKGYKVSGSDDEIHDPALSRLKAYDLLPESIGWNPEKITNDLDAVILGMHAKSDNPELLKAKEIELAYPDYKETDDQITIYMFRGTGCTYCRSFLIQLILYFDYLDLI